MTGALRARARGGVRSRSGTVGGTRTGNERTRGHGPGGGAGAGGARGGPGGTARRGFAAHPGGGTRGQVHGTGRGVRAERGRLAVDEAGERADHRARIAGDEARAQHHGFDVGLRVVIGEDRAAKIVRGAGGVQVARGGEDRVDGVVGVGVAGVGGVDAVLQPGLGHELHPPDGTGGGHGEVAAVVGLDFVDPGEDLPGNVVLDRGGLVDGQQEQRDAVEVERLRGGGGAAEQRGERAGFPADGLRRGCDAIGCAGGHRRGPALRRAGARAGGLHAGRAGAGGALAKLARAGNALLALHHDGGRGGRAFIGARGCGRSGGSGCRCGRLAGGARRRGGGRGGRHGLAAAGLAGGRFRSAGLGLGFGGGRRRRFGRGGRRG